MEKMDSLLSYCCNLSESSTIAQSKGQAQQDCIVRVDARQIKLNQIMCNAVRIWRYDQFMEIVNPYNTATITEITLKS